MTASRRRRALTLLAAAALLLAGAAVWRPAGAAAAVNPDLPDGGLALDLLFQDAIDATSSRADQTVDEKTYGVALLLAVHARATLTLEVTHTKETFSTEGYVSYYDDKLTWTRASARVRLYLGGN